MPDPNNYKDKKSFVSACIPVVLNEGTAESQDQAVAICNSMWENREMLTSKTLTEMPMEIKVSYDTSQAQHSASEDYSMDAKKDETGLRQDDLMRVQRVASVDMDNGTFGMTLATEGEASDGHILAVDGAQIVERMPMLISHWNEPTKAAGSIVKMRRHLQDKPRRLTAVGMMELDGEGEAVSMRRDLMHMIAQGHVNAVSVRWDFDWKDVVPRTKLPSDHPHFIDAEKEPSNSNRRYGYYFKRWTPREGSIVALGADPGALIGRAKESMGKVKTFWERMAEDAAQSQKETEGETKPQVERVMPDLPSLVAAFGARVRELGIEVEQLAKLGVPFDELVRIYEQNKPVAPIDETMLRMMQKIETLEERLAQAEKVRVRGAPPASDSLGSIVRQAIAEIREERRTQFEEFRQEIRRRRGEV